MKFKIRFADQIVGVFIILSLVSLALVIILLGRSQRWFARDYSYYTILTSANGLSKNMAVQYKGFTIGNVESFHLNESDDVEVIFSIHEEYNDRIKLGSIVELLVSPVGLGNQFLLHSGRGEQLAEGSFVPVAGSAQAIELIRQGHAMEAIHDDGITVLMNRAGSILDYITRILEEVEIAIGQGSDTTEIGKIVGSIQKTIAGAENLPQTVDQMLMDLQPALNNINELIAQVNDPDSLVYKVLDTEEDVYKNLVGSLASVSSMLDNLDKTTASQFPQIAGLIMELRTTIKTADDVLIALTNNPLLRKGVPERVESQSIGTSPRNIQF